MFETLDEVLSYHCAPTLLRLKPASLVSVSWREFPALEAQVAAYDRHFRGRGIRFRLLCTCRRNALLLVWHEALLARQLAQPLTQRILRRDGYRPEDGAAAMLDRLSVRLRRMEDFPHEVGLFLGYPPEDVEGFQRCRGRNCKLCGYWKVYSDVDRARALFRQYDRCREVLYPRVARGATLPQIFRAA